MSSPDLPRPTERHPFKGMQDKRLVAGTERLSPPDGVRAFPVLVSAAVFHTMALEGIHDDRTNPFYAIHQEGLATVRDEVIRFYRTANPFHDMTETFNTIVRGRIQTIKQKAEGNL